MAFVVGVLLFWLAIHLGSDAVEALPFGIGTPLLLGVAFWLWMRGAEEAVDHRAMRSVGATRHREGDWVAVAGRAVPLGETMRATLSDREALACSYQVFEEQRGRRYEDGRRSTYLGRLYEGYHLVPMGIENEYGTVPLRGLPDLVDLEKSGFGHGESRVDETAERLDKPERAAALAQLAALTQDRIAVDWKFGDAEEGSSLVRKEWVLSPGDAVCIFGRWDGQALTPSPRRPRGLPVYAGTADQVRAQLRGGSKVFFAFGLVPFLLAAWWTFTIVT
ncbi:MAG: hypothetical protein K8J08_10275 [Thermoanaerobaculia bacterium]|nr:hypothetical protein [Thermoanaerobaculia bacterium]